jgi:hypothetical protein
MVKTPSQHWTIPPLENGDSEALLRSADRLNRYEFERRYNAMPNLKKANLIEGIVYMPAGLSFKSHSQPHSWMIGWLVTYEATTPGTESSFSRVVVSGCISFSREYAACIGSFTRGSAIS